MTRFIRLLKNLSILLAAVYIGQYVFIALSRMTYPYELQWMEGGMVDHVRRLFSGQPLYLAPTVEFVPYIYPPFYFYLAAGVAGITGVDLWPLRLISFAASVGAFIVIALIVWRETHSRYAAFLAAGLFAATYAISGVWFDLIRIDSLFIFLTLLAIYAARFGSSGKSAVLAGVLFALAGLTKQTALMIVPAVSLYYLLFDRRRFVIFTGLVIAITAVSTLLLDMLHEGWYWYYVFELPGQHPWVWNMLLDFWLQDLAPVYIAGGIGIAYLAIVWRQGQEGRRSVVYYGLLLGAMTAAAWFSRLHEGGAVNVLFPVFAIIAVLFGLGTHQLVRSAKALPDKQRLKLLEVGVYALSIIQFAVLFYTPGAYIPTPADRAAGDLLIETISQIEGEVWLVHHGYLPALAGKDTIYAQRMGIEDVMRGTNEPVKAALMESITQALEARHFDAIIFDGSPDNFILVDYYFHALEANYTGRGEIFPPELDDAFWPVTGLRIRPYYIFAPRDTSE